VSSDYLDNKVLATEKADQQGFAAAAAEAVAVLDGGSERLATVLVA